MKTKLLICALAIALAGCQTITASEDHQPGYEAHGTEPFWSLVIAEGTMTFSHAGVRDVRVTRYDARPSFNGWRYTSSKITADVTFAECSDGMSDFTYKDTVTVMVSGQEHKGCGGGIVPPKGLDGTDWLLLSVAGEDIPSERQAMFAFAEGRMSGSLGCNRLGAAYKFANQQLSFGPLMLTRMACADPTGRQESAFTEIIASLVSTSFTPDGWMVLEGRDGRRIVLKRSG